MNELVVRQLDDVAKVGVEAQLIANQFEKTFAIADVVQRLQGLLTTQVLKPIMDLQGKKLGFKVDKPYPENIVRDCLIEATINGVYPVGNQFNIIAGNFYITKEGFAHKLKNISGLSYQLSCGIPKTQPAGAVVDVDIEYTFNGENKKKVLPLAIRVNSGMGSDAIIGKATRKASAWLYNTITGQNLQDGDTDDIINVTPKTSKLETETPAKDELL